MPRKSANSDTPKIPRLPKTQYPTGRTVPEAARREVYALFRAEAEGVLGVLKEIVYDEMMDPGHRIAAGKEILNRGLGTAPNVEIVEKTLKVDLTISDEKIKQLSNDELQATLAVLQRVIADPNAEDAEVIEHKP